MDDLGKALAGERRRQCLVAAIPAQIPAVTDSFKGSLQELWRRNQSRRRCLAIYDTPGWGNGRYYGHG